MIKAILWDADGVTIQKHAYFSERLAETYGIAPEVGISAQVYTSFDDFKMKITPLLVNP